MLLSKNYWKYEQEKEEQGVTETKTLVQKSIFGEDKEGIDPEYLCRTCVRMLEKVNQDYHKDQKYKKENTCRNWITRLYQKYQYLLENI